MATSYGHDVTTKFRLAEIREILGLLLLLAGIIGLLVVTFQYDVRLGYGLLSIGAITAGYYLVTER